MPSAVDTVLVVMFIFLYRIPEATVTTDVWLCVFMLLTTSKARAEKGDLTTSVQFDTNNCKLGPT